MTPIYLRTICVIVFLYCLAGCSESRKHRDPINSELDVEQPTFEAYYRRHVLYSQLGDYFNPLENPIQRPERLPRPYGRPSSYPFETTQRKAPIPDLTTPDPDMPITTEAPKIKKEIRELSQGAESFSMHLFKTISTAPENADVNFVVSPFSIWSLMTLVSQGAAENSERQLKTVLQLPALENLGAAYGDFEQTLFSNTSTVGLSMNQAVFSDENGQINEDFVDDIKHNYNADHLPVNFTDRANAARSINNYIRRETKGKVSNIVNPQDLIDTHLLLSSSILFNGEWKYPFNASHTKPQPFYNEHGVSIGKVEMMTMQNPLRFANFENLNASIVELPYGHEDRLAILLIYPIRNATLSNVFENLGRVDVKAIHREVYKYDDVGDVIVNLPKFKIDTDMEMHSVLHDMGIRDVFDRTKANLSYMSKDPLFISKVVHKAVIEVDEVGTVASAVSYANAVDFAYPLEYNFNKPFGFMITERRTHTLLFAGQVRNPLA